MFQGLGMKVYDLQLLPPLLLNFTLNQICNKVFSETDIQLDPFEIDVWCGYRFIHLVAPPSTRMLTAKGLTTTFHNIAKTIRRNSALSIRLGVNEIYTAQTWTGFSDYDSELISERYVFLKFFVFNGSIAHTAAPATEYKYYFFEEKRLANEIP
jgi:hypothetical protein